MSGCLITAVVEGRCESEDEFRDARLAQDERAAELKRQEDEELAWQEYAERIGN